MKISGLIKSLNDTLLKYGDMEIGDLKNQDRTRIIDGELVAVRPEIRVNYIDENNTIVIIGSL